MKQDLSLEQKIELTNLQARIIEHLKTGHENATSLKDLCNMTACKERKLRIAIEALRSEGYPLLSSARKPAGYYFASTEEEGQEFLAFYLSYIKDLCVTRQAVKMALKKKFSKQFGQLTLMLK